jgi:hypothetical protein
MSFSFLVSSLSQQKKIKKQRISILQQRQKEKVSKKENIRICKRLKKKFEAFDALAIEEAQKQP